MRRGGACALAMLWVLQLVLFVAGCRNRPDGAATTVPAPSTETAVGGEPSSSAQARTQGPASALPAAASSAPSGVGPSNAWFVGTWTGSYTTSVHRIDLPSKTGGLPEWAGAGDPANAAGHGTLTIAAAADGTVTGTAEGSLGDQEVRGAFEGDAFTARLVPKTREATAYAGTLTAHREASQAVGTLAASTGNGHDARAGTITLAKSPP